MQEQKRSEKGFRFSCDRRASNFEVAHNRVTFFILSQAAAASTRSKFGGQYL